MIYLVTGGSGSGKSEYAESLILRSPCQVRYYVATMAVYGEEGRRKVLRHQMLRGEKGFITLERQRDVGMALPGQAGSSESDAVVQAGTGESDAAVLLECVSNLAANEMFGRGQEPLRDTRALAGRIVKDISRLGARARDLVIVTNEVAGDGNTYEPETMEYIRLMGLVNQSLAKLADQVVEVVYGIPVRWKG